MSAYKQIQVYQNAKTLAVDIHKMTLNQLPRFEMYEQGQQIRRSSKSVPANIAEGFKKKGKQDKVRFMNIAQGSLEECRYYFIPAKDLGYFETNELTGLLEEVSKLLEAYSSSIPAPGS